VKILVDMNLSPDWVSFFESRGFTAQHWSALGELTASDRTIMSFARSSGWTVFTHDLDFGNILAVTAARGPSVIQVRTQDPTPRAAGEMLITALRTYGVEPNEEPSSRLSLIECEPAYSRSIEEPTKYLGCRRRDPTRDRDDPLLPMPRRG
jgi:predicted nuclease of predicted toxin-antitoxin system